jgi:hypothetical protein
MKNEANAFFGGFGIEGLEKMLHFFNKFENKHKNVVKNRNRVFIIKTNSCYYGEYCQIQGKTDLPHGIGVLYSIDGTKYCGNFNSGVFHGEGTLYEKSQEKCAQFFDGEIFGTGWQTFDFNNKRY